MGGLRALRVGAQQKFSSNRPQREPDRLGEDRQVARGLGERKNKFEGERVAEGGVTNDLR